MVVGRPLTVLVDRTAYVEFLDVMSYPPVLRYLDQGVHCKLGGHNVYTVEELLTECVEQGGVHVCAR